MKYLILLSFLFISIFAKEMNKQCKFFYKYGVENIKYECLVSKTTKGFIFDDVEKHIIKDFIFKDKYNNNVIFPSNCESINFNINNPYLDNKIEKCNIILKGENYPIKLKNDQINLLNILEALNKSNLNQKEINIQEFKELSILLHLFGKIGEFKILVDFPYKELKKEEYQEKFDELPIWKKMLVFYDKRFDYIGIDKKYLDIGNVSGKIEDLKVVGLIENKKENELVVFFKEDKKSIKISFELNNFLTLDKLYNAIEYQQTEFDYFLEKYRLGKLKGFYEGYPRLSFRDMNLIKKNKKDFYEYNNQKMIQWILHMIPKSLDEQNYSLKPSEHIILKIFKTNKDKEYFDGY